MFQKSRQLTRVFLSVLLLVLFACKPKKPDTQPQTPDKTVVVTPEKTTVVHDVGIPDGSKKVEEPTVEPKAEPAGTLCIKGPGKHNAVGKGSGPKRPPSKNEREVRRKRAKKVNRGFTIELGGKTTTVKGDEGATIDGLSLMDRHRVKVRFSTGGSHRSFAFRFEENETRMCAYYNSFYDNWRVRKVRKSCGPCSKE